MDAERALRLYGRSGSHFTRVAAMFAHELGVTVESVTVRDLGSLDASDYGGNVALKIPTLHVDGVALFGTENICRRLVELAGRAGDPRVVLPERVTADLARSAQEMVWHAMAAQVQLVVGLVFSRLPADALLFVKARAGMTGALAWLDEHLDEALALLPAPRDLSVLEVSLFCLVEHVVFRPTVPLDPYPRLRAFAEDFGRRESAQRTPYRAERAVQRDAT